MDANELVAALRHGVAVSSAPADAAGPTDADAVRQWGEHLGLRRGTYATPAAWALAPLVEAWCLERGWHVRPTAIRVGQGLGLLGLRSKWRDGHHGYGVQRELAERLWAAVGPLPPGVKRRRLPKTPTRPGPLGPVLACSPGELRHALVDSLGCVWRDATQAAKHLRCAPRAITNAAGPRASGHHVAGRRHWRRLGKPSEWLEKLPEGALFGVPGTMCWCRGNACMVPYEP